MRSAIHAFRASATRSEGRGRERVHPPGDAVEVRRGREVHEAVRALLGGAHGLAAEVAPDRADDRREHEAEHLASILGLGTRTEYRTPADGICDDVTVTELPQKCQGHLPQLPLLSTHSLQFVASSSLSRS